eukprot:5655068-Prymnesium_polylepis.1
MPCPPTHGRRAAPAPRRPRPPPRAPPQPYASHTEVGAHARAAGSETERSVFLLPMMVVGAALTLGISYEL